LGTWGGELLQGCQLKALSLQLEKTRFWLVDTDILFVILSAHFHTAHISSPVAEKQRLNELPDKWMTNF
jgi:hypothetical protein